MAATTAPLPLTPGRRAALAIGVPVCLLLVAYTGLGLVADFGEGRYPVSYTAPAATRSLTVDVAGGQLSIGPAASGPATVTGTARYSLIRSTLSERTVGGTTAVVYHCVDLPVGDCALDATVSVPAAMAVSADTGGGNATVTGATGPVTLSSGGGNLTAGHIAGPLTMSTGGGNVQATAITSPALTVTTGGGDIQATTVNSATVTVTTAGGNIDATAVSAATVTASTGGGEIELVFATVPRDVQVNTSGGDVVLVLPPGSAQYHVTAHTDGGDVTDTLPQNTSSPNVITVTTGGGNISLGRQ